MRRLLVAAMCVGFGLSSGAAAAQDGGTDSPPVLAPPSFRESASTLETPPAPSAQTVSPVLPLSPPEPPATIEIYEPDLGHVPATLDGPRNPELPRVTDEVIARESPCLSAACSPPCGYPSCGCSSYGVRCLGPKSWFVAAEATWLAVLADSGGAAVATFDDAALAGVEATLSGGQGLDGFAVAPRIALGYQRSERWGFLGRFWTLSDSESATPGSVPPQTGLDGLITGEAARVELTAAGLEVVRSFAPGCWQLDAALGARYASLGISTSMAGSADFAGDNLADTRLFNDTSFDGAGLTGALTLRRPIAATRAQVFLSGRGSTLWGSAASRSQAETALITPTGAAFGRLAVDRQEDREFAFIGELQLGLEWSARPTSSRVTPFVRLAGECQWWMVDAPLSSSATVDLSGTTIDALSVSSAGAGEIELSGVSLAAGMTW